MKLGLAWYRARRSAAMLMQKADTSPSRWTASERTATEWEKIPPTTSTPRKRKQKIVAMISLRSASYVSFSDEP